MAVDLARSRAEHFFMALATRDPDRIEPFLDENVDWLVIGPADMFPHCGQRVGRQAVVEAYERLSTNVEAAKIARDFLIVENDTAAALTRVTLVHSASGRQISFRLAHFVRFRGGKVVEFCAMADCLGAIEQLLGKTLDLDLATLAPV
jgi:ketosteroid isomerase-like protein